MLVFLIFYVLFCTCMCLAIHNPSEAQYHRSFRIKKQEQNMDNSPTRDQAASPVDSKDENWEKLTSKRLTDKTVGILGGLGPEATVHFLSRILARTVNLYHASIDQQHIPIIIQHNPTVPNRNDAIDGVGTNCGPHLRDMTSSLVKSGAVDFIVLACNTAHAFQSYIEEGCENKVPFVSMIDVTCNEVAKRMNIRGSDNNGRKRKCGILAGGGCIRANLFQNSLLQRHIEPIIPSPSNQELMQSIIYRIKAGDKGMNVLNDFIKVIQELKEEKGCECIVVGCTELPLILEKCLDMYNGVKIDDFVDSTDVMVDTLIRISKNDLELNSFLN
uniref:Aspartate racemase n=1 Tax=Ditylum brightwellii TaxID=49249 RepID=A0A7S1ZLJ7_9STRA|mmetsp:Transcript_3431/g.5297  ORF Transcript_3431/g.5297 Transcript_3431/m.5297 type:complete len:330 (+) Transcript_3431:205-1194(+)